MKPKKIVNLLALDIDEVLNSLETRQKLHDIRSDLSIEDQIKAALEVGIKLAVLPGHEDRNYCYGHVDLFKQQSLSKVCKHNNVEVIGISSWFIGAKMEEKEVQEYFNEFFGLKFIGWGFGANANNRLYKVADWIKEHYDLNEVDVNLVYLDDDCRINATYIDGYKPLNLKAFKFLTNDINTLFIFPKTDAGMLPKHVKLMGHFWSNGNSCTPADAVITVPSTGSEPIYK